MTATIAFLLLVVLPSVLGWVVFLWCGGLWIAYLLTHKKQASNDATDAWVKRYNAQLLARYEYNPPHMPRNHTPAKRKRALRAIVGGRVDPPAAA